MSDETRVWLTKRKGTKKGKVVFRYSLRWLDVTTGKWRCKAAGTDSKRAERAAADLENQLAAGTYQDVKRVGWSEFAEDHVAKIPGRGNAEEAGRTLKEFGEVCRPASPKRVTYTLVERYVTHLRAKGNKAATINKKLRYLRAAMNRARKRGCASFIENPVDRDLDQPMDEKVIRVATPAEEASLLDAAERLYGFRVRAFVLTALGTGARRSELTGLSWENVHLDGSSPHVVFTKTKTHKVRTVPINTDVVAVLRRLQAQTLQVGGPFIGLEHNINRTWRQIVQEAGVRPITIHDLRRTYITRLVEAGVDMPTVKRLVGHERTETTERYYTGIRNEHLRDAVSRLQRIVG